MNYDLIDYEVMLERERAKWLMGWAIVVQVAGEENVTRANEVLQEEPDDYYYDYWEGPNW